MGWIAVLVLHELIKLKSHGWNICLNMFSNLYADLKIYCRLQQFHTDVFYNVIPGSYVWMALQSAVNLYICAWLTSHVDIVTGIFYFTLIQINTFEASTAVIINHHIYISVCIGYDFRLPVCWVSVNRGDISFLLFSQSLCHSQRDQGLIPCLTFICMWVC